jgi:hypothetical protein
VQAACQVRSTDWASDGPELSNPGAVPPTREHGYAFGAAARDVCVASWCIKRICEGPVVFAPPSPLGVATQKPYHF